jgi:hypothetical protein
MTQAEELAVGVIAGEGGMAPGTISQRWKLRWQPQAA